MNQGPPPHRGPGARTPQRQQQPKQQPKLSPPPSPPPPPTQQRATNFSFTGEQFLQVFTHVFSLYQQQQQLQQSTASISGDRPLQFLDTPSQVNNQDQQQTYRFLAAKLTLHHYALHPSNAIAYQRAYNSNSSNLQTSSQCEAVICELLCAYLLELEATCDRTNALLDTIMATLSQQQPPQSQQQPPQTFSLDGWLAELQRLLEQLAQGRLALARYCRPLPAAGGATYLNAGTVAEDAQVVALTLGWLRNAAHYNVMAES
ncbi:hypothetical protein TYRP_007822 [Tyrophagus putrescentiae]|nr:hypothetical protein TYRP_007822 [Tyrophagus putrescentiae]